MNKDKNLNRNMCNDIPLIYFNISKYTLECFEKLSDEKGNVLYSVMFSCIIQKTKGTVNPLYINRFLDEFIN